MAVSAYGVGGPQRAYAAFQAKAQGAAPPPVVASRYRTGFRMTDYASIILALLLWRLYAVS
jgi:hypothetical protein